jgi:RimJ/RimL family protein N-acetyltransferase
MTILKRSRIEDLEKFIVLDKQKDVYEFIIRYSLDEYIEFFNDSRIIYLTIFDDRIVFAVYIILAVEDNNKSVEFKRIVIDEKKRGIGQTTIKLMEKFCNEELIVRRIWLDVFEHNKKGMHVYQKLGYSKFKEEEYEGKNLLFFEKLLE